MWCKKCGHEIPDDANFCPFCGEVLNEEITKTITFKDGIMALFSKLFVFDGKASRSEFNYGLLFLMILSSILSMFLITPELGQMNFYENSNGFEGMFELFQSKNILDSYNLYNIGVSIISSYNQYHLTF